MKNNATQSGQTLARGDDRQEWARLYILGIILASVLLYLLPVDVAQAESMTVLRMGESLSLDDEQTVAGDYYGIGSSIALSGIINGDAQLVGAQTTLNGKVESDLLAVGLAVDVYGDIGDDARIIGVEVTVASHIAGDLVVVANQLTVLPTAKIDGDIIFFGQRAEIAGTVGHNIMGRMGSMQLDGSVGGEIEKLSVGTLIFGEKAKVTGGVSYASYNELVRAPGTVIGGSITKTEVDAPAAKNTFRVILEIMLPLLFATLCWFLIFRHNLTQLVSTGSLHTARSIMLGVAVAVVMPLIIGLLLISGLGVLLGILLLGVYIVLFCTAIVASSAMVGEWLRQAILPKQKFGVLFIVLGVAVVTLMLIVPYGSYLHLGIIVFTLGAIAERMYSALR